VSVGTGTRLIFYAASALAAGHELHGGSGGRGFGSGGHAVAAFTSSSQRGARCRTRPGDAGGGNAGQRSTFDGQQPPVVITFSERHPVTVTTSWSGNSRQLLQHRGTWTSSGAAGRRSRRHRVSGQLAIQYGRRNYGADGGEHDSAYVVTTFTTASVTRRRRWCYRLTPANGATDRERTAGVITFSKS